MLLRSLTLLALTSPNVIFYSWLATSFGSLTDIVNNKLAVSFFLEMTAATLLVSYLLWAKPMGNVRVRWFTLISLFAGVGVGLPVFYWLNKQAPKAARTLRIKRREFNAAKKERQAEIAAQAAARPALILHGQSV